MCCLLVVLVKLSLFAKWLARKTPEQLSHLPYSSWRYSVTNLNEPLRALAAIPNFTDSANVPHYTSCAANYRKRQWWRIGTIGVHFTFWVTVDCWSSWTYTLVKLLVRQLPGLPDLATQNTLSTNLNIKCWWNAWFFLHAQKGREVRLR